jgi:uncharacterized protein
VIAYLDASALVKLAVEEPESAAMRAFAAAFPSLASSLVASAELRRALQRRYDAVPDDANVVMESVTAIAVDEVVLARAGRVGPPELRTLDAIHLATAIGIGAELEALVTYDMRLAAAARALGIAVVSPGVPVVPREARALPEVHEAG